MPDEQRIREVLEEVLDSERTPEEVCAGDPDLLRAVRARWERLRRFEQQVDALFPSADATRLGHDTPLPEIELPQVDGYDVQAVLGRGGMGVVFKARQLLLNRLVALKMLRAGAHAEPQELLRFRREAEAVAALRHPNIVQLYEVGDLDGRPYFTMEFVEGGSLAQQLARTTLPVRQAAELIATLAVAVQFAHQSGFIHRDLKPANVLRTADGTPKIADFGLVRSIARGPEFTFSGTRLGTPNYMAPEQALGKASAIGPAVDVYALGAVLYETLTGRPPFEGETPADTERRVIADEPAPPSRMNPRVPRDLETICLKCLQKQPARRYASAQDLADDLYRFLDSKPVLARPVGVVERVAKWARRRPTLAMLIAALVVALVVAIGAGMWLDRQASARQEETANRRARARQAIETVLAETYASGKAERWREARLLLAGADSHLANADSPELRRQLARAEADLCFAQELERIRRSAVTAAPGLGVVLPHLVDFQRLATEYRKAFAQAGLHVDAAAAGTAAHIRASALRERIVSALDEWALAAFMLKRPAEQEQLLRIARLAAPDPAWGDRLRTPAVWADQKQLHALAADALAGAKSPPAHQLGLVSTLLTHHGVHSEGIRLLREALLRRPQDSWLNWELGKAYCVDSNFKESVQFFRVVTALRPEDPWTVDNLGCALMFAEEFDEAVVQFRHALKTHPEQEGLLRNFAVALIRANRTAEALATSQRFLEAAPNNAEAVFLRGLALAHAQRHAEALPMFRKAIALNPNALRAHYNLGVALTLTGRPDQAVGALQRTLQVAPNDVFGHYTLGVIYQDLRKHEEALAEFRWIIRELEPKLSFVKPDRGEGLYTRYVGSRIRQARSLLCLGRFAEAHAAAERALALPHISSAGLEQLRYIAGLCKPLLPLEPSLPAILAGKAIPRDPDGIRALAEWYSKHKHTPLAAVRLYAVVFARQPSLAEDVKGKYRFAAACAAALAGAVTGTGAAGLDAGKKAALRQQALTWLRADVAAWAKRAEHGGDSERADAAQAGRDCQLSKALAGVRAAPLLARLPERERKDWQQLWADVEKLAGHDPRTATAQARAHVDHKQWARAAAVYAQLLKDGRSTDGDLWFEYAAVQLLSGDRAGYRETCKRMASAQLRGYLVARAWTLAPASVDDLARPAQLSAEELQRDATEFWSLTEQGALYCRRNRARDALPLLEQSLRAEPRRGAAVLNWLWLALAHQQLGDTDSARQWLKRAASWLDAVGEKMPAGAAGVKLHRHNWLEAHLLRREAELLLLPSAGKDSSSRSLTRDAGGGP